MDQLAREFDGTFSPATIRRFVDESHDLVARFLTPVTARGVSPRVRGLTRRFASERLGALARADRLVPRPVPEVLFICVQNAGRSQMAAALLDRYAGGRAVAHSAGSAPGAEIHPAVAVAMAEIGIDLADAFPKPLTDEAVRAADIVVTMGCGDSCPVLPGKCYHDWRLDDPAEGGLDQARQVRDEVDRRVQELWAIIVSHPTLPDGRPNL
ncbi:arsenate reductase ArsC [Raineyella sp. W15-4]|uniref:arsenate reductase ArsC n=1 Tax=Raineyella sp. W15-4 TaxID=3081651 RepID=UPI002953A60C|nr:arsenate reductase ArsC [Raineyella sp. W15-4]WOQ17167.1 arsenate reductase ArsC [Raineyella sp. W15-4]